jgi:hypothetical protein
MGTIIVSAETKIVAADGGPQSELARLVLGFAGLAIGGGGFRVPPSGEVEDGEAQVGRPGQRPPDDRPPYLREVSPKIPRRHCSLSGPHAGREVDQ